MHGLTDHGGRSYVSETESDPEIGSSRFLRRWGVNEFPGIPFWEQTQRHPGRGAYSNVPKARNSLDKITYKVMFRDAGTYYLYMRFTMFENGGNLTHYISEDSFFLSRLNKDPQNDWGLLAQWADCGYCEGCCDKLVVVFPVVG